MISLNSEKLTAEQFAEKRFDLPEGGRWTELVAGEVVQMMPPDDQQHGTTVLNFTKALAEYLHALSEPVGYACYELGLVVQRKPDTVRCPAMSFFAEGGSFAETDQVVTESVPALVMEVVSTNDRRRELNTRVGQYLQIGVDHIWIVDPLDSRVHLLDADQNLQELEGDREITCELLPGFRLSVADLFAAPEWF